MASDTDEDGASVTANSLSLNLGTIGDLAGNAASLGHGAVRAVNDQKVDTTAPAVLRVTWPVDTGSSNSDGITKENRVTISTPEADAIWEYSVNSGKDWTTGTDTGFTLSEGRYAIDAIQVRQTDEAGNRSPVSKNPTEITVDTSAPVALTMTLPSDTGSSNSDGITHANRVTISTPEAGASWEYLVNGGKDWTAGTDTGFTLSDGRYAKDAIQVRQTDEAGNTSLVSGNAKEITVDTSAPVALAMTLPLDTGTSSSDGLTNANRVTISTPEAGASWEYSVNSGKDWTAGTDTDFTLSDGVYAIDAIQVRQTDAASNRSLVSKNPTEITVDTRAPVALTMTLPVDTGSSSSDGITKENRVTISTPEAEASWEYSSDSGNSWTDGGSGRSFTLSDGTYVKDAIQVRQTDAAGNRSLVSGNAKEITVDRAAPVALTMTLPVDTGSSSSDGLTKENKVTISTPEAGASWEYSVNSGTDWTTGSGRSFTLSEGSYAKDAIRVRQTDEAGNTSLVRGNATEITVDRAPPVVTSTSITSKGPYREGDVIEVTVTYGETVVVGTTGGRPSLTLLVGTTERQAEYQSGSDSTALVFRYEVVVSDTDADGVSVMADSLELNSGAITDKAGNAASLGNRAVGVVKITEDGAGGDGLTASLEALQDAEGIAVEGDFSYQWQRSPDGGDSWADIVGATGESYVLTRADVARWVRLVVRLTDVDGVETVYSTTAGRIVPNTVAPVVDTGPVVVSRDSRVRSEEVPSVSNLVDVTEVGPGRFDDLARLPGQVRDRRPALPEVVDDSASVPRPGPEGRPALPEVVDDSASVPRPGPEGRPALPEVVDESAGTVRVVGRWGVDAGSDDGKFRLNLSEVVAAVKQQVEVGYPEDTAEVEEMPAEIAIAGLLVEGVCSYLPWRYPPGWRSMPGARSFSYRM